MLPEFDLWTLRTLPEALAKRKSWIAFRLSARAFLSSSLVLPVYDVIMVDLNQYLSL